MNATHHQLLSACLPCRVAQATSATNHWATAVSASRLHHGGSHGAKGTTGILEDSFVVERWLGGTSLCAQLVQHHKPESWNTASSRGTLVLWTAGLLVPSARCNLHQPHARLATSQQQEQQDSSYLPT
jgi:hypothetical protein